MEILIQISLALVFYSFMWFLHSYSRGNYNVKDERREQYDQWVERNGKKASRAIRTLAITF